MFLMTKLLQIMENIDINEVVPSKKFGSVFEQVSIPTKIVFVANNKQLQYSSIFQRGNGVNRNS